MYGGFWRRLAAYFIDQIVLSFVVAIFGFILILLLNFEEYLSVLMNSMNVHTFNFQAFLLQLVFMYAFSFITQWLYYAIFESSPLHGTPGKMALGLRITDSSGNGISFGKATGRYFAKALSSLILCIGYLMIAFTERKQGLHDFVAGTFVTFYSFTKSERSKTVETDLLKELREGKIKDYEELLRRTAELQGNRERTANTANAPNVLAATPATDLQLIPADNPKKNNYLFIIIIFLLIAGFVIAIAASALPGSAASSFDSNPGVLTTPLS